LPTVDEIFTDIQGFTFASVIDHNTGTSLSHAPKTHENSWQ
jgi:hypothetical protein